MPGGAQRPYPPAGRRGNVGIVSGSAAHGPGEGGESMRAQVGDELIVESTVPVPSRRVGVVIGLKNADGSPPYLVHWVVGDYTSLIFPGPNTRMIVRHKAQHPGGA